MGVEVKATVVPEKIEESSINLEKASADAVTMYEALEYSAVPYQ